MNDLIKKIWNEEFRPAEGFFAYSDEIRSKEMFLDNYEDMLTKLLDKDSIKIFEDFKSIFFEILDLERLDAFTGGVHFTGRFIKGILMD